MKNIVIKIFLLSLSSFAFSNPNEVKSITTDITSSDASKMLMMSQETMMHHMPRTWFYWRTNRLDIKNPNSELLSEETSINSKVIKQHYWGYRTISLMSKDFKTKEATGSIRFFKTVRIAAKDGSYLGQIHKKWFTKDGNNLYEIKNKKNEIVALAKNEGDLNGFYKQIIVRSTKSEFLNKIIARIDLPRKINHAQDKDNAYNGWKIKLEVDANELFTKYEIDSRVMALFVPYITYWDNSGITGYWGHASAKKYYLFAAASIAVVTYIVLTQKFYGSTIAQKVLNGLKGLFGGGKTLPQSTTPFDVVDGTNATELPTIVNANIHSNFNPNQPDDADL